MAQHQTQMSVVSDSANLSVKLNTFLLTFCKAVQKYYQYDDEDAIMTFKTPGEKLVLNIYSQALVGGDKSNTMGHTQSTSCESNTCLI